MSQTDICLTLQHTGDLSYLRGPAGRDGRDGRDGIDGKDCDPADCTAANTDSSVQGTGGGSTYIRWGRTSCANSSQLLYTGKTVILLSTIGWVKLV